MSRHLVDDLADPDRVIDRRLRRRQTLQLRSIWRSVPQSGLLRLRVRDRLFDLILPGQMNEAGPTEGRFKPPSISLQARMKNRQFLTEKVKTVPLQPQAEHSGVKTAFRHGRFEDRR